MPGSFTLCADWRVGCETRKGSERCAARLGRVRCSKLRCSKLRILGLALGESARVAPRLKTPMRKMRSQPLPEEPQPSKVERVALRTCALGWAALSAYAYDPERSRILMTTCFALPTATFEDNVREPAAGLLETTAPLGSLEAVLLLGLASSAALALNSVDRARLGLTLATTSAVTIGAFYLAVSEGMPLESLPQVAFFDLLVSMSFLASVKSAASSDISPAEIVTADGRALLTGGPAAGEDADLASDGGGQVALFYRSSTVVGLLVGAAFLLSPVSPIALFDEELPVTHLFRQYLGVFIAFLLCPVQAALYRAARRGTLAEPTTRKLNTATGVCIAGLVLDGRNQVDTGTRAFAALPADDPLRAIVDAASVASGSRPEANTTAAFSVGICVALVYLWQAAFNSGERE
jgi:hypothetical protein